ncbi:MAG: AAA family ATPase [Patescibacteria group bacterium]
MYLKRLEIRGFKSFAEKTVLEFLPYKNNRNSVTVIVGPNGSGKSNISDAVRWVMGEQSLKNLRGKKNEDVIFSGSETKGQLGAAEVTMTLDNGDGRLLSDYPEIIITRRLYRSGEAEYLVNNNAARLIDIHLLLAKAQFAQHSYSVVGQGMIDKLLTVGPVERKDFLDEASGIKEFQIKQHQAELKLTRTTENVAQAERLMQEVEPRLKILSKQVKKLEKRQEVELKLREMQEKYYASIYLTNKNELDGLVEKLNLVENSYRGAFKELEDIQNELAVLARASGRGDAFNELQSKFQVLAKEKNDLERQLAIKDGQTHAQYNAAGKQNVSWTQNKIAELKLQHDSLSGQMAATATEINDANRLVLEQKNLLDQITKEKTEKQIKISDLERQVMQDQSEQHYRQFTGLLAVQAVLENKDKFGKVYGLISELGDSEEKFRTALEAAAGSYLSAIVVESDDVAGRAIEFLHTNRLGVATFLPLNKIVPKGSENIHNLLSQPGVCGLASELIRFEPKLSNIFSFVFGQTIVVEDLAAAKRIGIGSARMVTLSGDVIEKTGVMKGGYRQAKKAGLGFSRKLLLSPDKFIEYQSQINAGREEIAGLETKYEKAKTQLFVFETKSQSAHAKFEVLNSELKNLAQEVAGLEQELSLFNADPKQYDKILAQLLVEKDALSVQIKAKEDTLNKLSEKIDNFNKEEEDKKQRVFALQDQMQKKQNKLNEILSARNDLKIEIAKLETKQDAIGEEVRAEMNAAIEAVVERKPPTVEAEKIIETANEIQKLKYQLSLIGGIDAEVVEEHQQTKEKYDFLSGQIEDLHSAMTDLDKMIVELDEVMKKKRAAAFKKIRKEFDRYVKILFGGGNADMTEIYGEPESEADEDLAGAEGELPEEKVVSKRKEKILTGIDISINPPGKKIKHINTLSGGERTLASIALICAVLNYNPSPFVVLDEVEAALDETNTRRFVQILSELSEHSQFIIITHNRVTMHSADALYGVVMGGDGISKLLSVKMEEVGVARGDQSIDKAV